jgi:uncharacterized protein YjiS (DUF1127 family)
MEILMTYVNVAHAGHAAPERRRVRIAVPMSLPVTWLRRMRQRRELETLLSRSDRFLQDIGLSRDEIEIEVRKPFWRR